jgi:hypothetical protein
MQATFAFETREGGGVHAGFGGGDCEVSDQMFGFGEWAPDIRRRNGVSKKLGRGEAGVERAVGVECFEVFVG